MSVNRRAVFYFLAAIFFALIAVFAFAQVGVNLTATNTDTLIVDQNRDGLADPGDVIQYTVTIINCGPDTASNPNYFAEIDPNTSLIPGSIQVFPPVGTDLVNCGISQPPASPTPVNADAIDDSFVVTNGGTTVDNVMTNDAGQAPLQVISFGDSIANVNTYSADGVTVRTFPAPGGGTIDVTINSSGNISITANGTTGTGTVTIFYQIQAGNATTDIAQIDITFGDFPFATDDTLATLGSGSEYSTDQGTTLIIPAGTGLFNNDALGTPAATLTLWGGGDASPLVDRSPASSRPFAGGTLTVYVDGSFDLVNPTTPGIFTFDYIIDNGIATSQATVEIYINDPPVAAPDSFTVAIGTVDSSNNVITNDALGAPPAVVDFYADTGDIGGTSQVAAPGTYTHPLGNFQVTIDASGNLTVDASVGGVTPGTYDFDYQITNSSGSSVATVTINIVQTPIANDDTFSVVVGSNLAGNVTADNGSGADNPGTPPFTSLTFGGGNLGGSVTDNLGGATVSFAGGSLTLNNDGSMTLNGATTWGQFTFQYQLTNAQYCDCDD